MRAALAFALLVCPAGAQAPARKKAVQEAAPELVRVLREGRWRLAIGGAICNACTRAVVEALRRIDGGTAAAFRSEERRVGKECRL